MEWTVINPYGDEQMIWISGIYKVRTYDGIHFHAYFFKDTDKNWGWNPSTPPEQQNDYPSRFWSSLKSAQLACQEHAISYIPKPKTISRALEVRNSLIAEAAADLLERAAMVAA